MNIIETLEKEGMKVDVPAIAIGDQVKVFVKIVEGNKERLQAYEGIVVAKKNGGIRETVTVRRVTYGVGVNRTFPIHAPLVDHIEIVRHGKVRRAKLNYLKTRTGKAAKLKETK
jgi:large subunit ribosomal protein L19